MKRKYLFIILVLILVISLGVSYAFKVQIKEYSNNDFKVSYDSTWKKDKKDDSLLLIHKKSNSKLEIQSKVLDVQYINTDLSDIINDVIYSVEEQNRGYKLINRSSNTHNNYQCYSFLYEKDMEQVLVNVYKKNNKLVIAYYEANSEYYDIVLDSVDTIFDSLEIIAGENVN